MLKEKGHEVFPVHPRVKNIEGQPVYSSIKEINAVIDTISLYVGPEVSNAIGEDIIRQKPRRIIFNPGAENENLASKARGVGIEAVNACTLVLLTTGQF